jgi:hypothetical protein
LREAQSLVATWTAAEVPLVVPVLSLLVAAHECQGELPEVDFLLASGPAAVVVVPLTRQSAPAAAAGVLKIHPKGLEVAHVIWWDRQRPRRAGAAGRDLLAGLVRRRKNPGHPSVVIPQRAAPPTECVGWLAWWTPTSRPDTALPKTPRATARDAPDGSGQAPG